jgi:hypothetical protein
MYSLSCQFVDIVCICCLFLFVMLLLHDVCCWYDWSCQCNDISLRSDEPLSGCAENARGDFLNGKPSSRSVQCSGARGPVLVM